MPTTEKNIFSSSRNMHWFKHKFPRIKRFTYIHKLKKISYEYFYCLYDINNLLNIMYNISDFLHFISAGKCKKSEMLYITWLVLYLLLGVYYNGPKFKCQPTSGIGWFSYKIWTKTSKTPIVNLFKNLRPFWNYILKIQWAIHFWTF